MWRWPFPRALAVAAFMIAAQLAVFGPALAQPADARPLTVFAAASLKTALDAVSADYQTSTGSKIVLSYASSAALAKQIEQAAPADVFISADLAWMDYLAGQGLIDRATQTNLLGNRLVLIAPKSSVVALKVEKNFALADAIGNGKLAVGDVASVPAGKYAKAALENLGVWAAAEPKLAQVENVRAALALVARQEATLGIVYKTDAAAEPNVKVIDTFPEATHPPIVYPIAVTAASKASGAAKDFVAYLRSPAAKTVFETAGFKVLAN